MKKLKKILLGTTLFVTMCMLTACGCGNGNGNNAADETPIIDDNTIMDEAEPDVTEMPENDRNNGTSQNNTTGTAGEYSGTVEYDTNGTVNGDMNNGTADGNSNDNNENANDKNSNNGNSDDGTVSGELGNSVEDLGEGVGDAVRDVGDAVGNIVDGDNNSNTNR